MAASAAKANAARRAASLVKERLLAGASRVGVGTGSTTRLVLETLLEDPEASRALRAARLYASSLDTLLALRSHGLEASTMAPREPLDLYFDGLDEFSPQGCHVVKGRGAALTREKILAYNSAYVILVADSTKLARAPGGLGKPLPVEAVAAAAEAVAAAIEEMGVRAEIRGGCSCRDGPAITDNYGVIIDTWPWGVMEPREFASRVSSIPGVVEHGLFTGYVDVVVIGSERGAEVYQCRRSIGRRASSRH